ncbi:MAG: PEP-CTERM sorting domain-containing protein [Pyrinomonadaceae bacterium]|nr:PEP-CTERM sorting domain-containing protein [Pyrinomonadaceae bacterium]
MRNRAFRPTGAILSLLLLTGGPVHAGPVAISQVMQIVGSYQTPPELRLRSLTQTASTPVAAVKGSLVTSGVKRSSADGPGIIADSTVTSSDSLLAGVAVNSNDPQRGVEIIDQGDVEGTICDCGEILIPVGGFPKWPLLFLAAIPFFFIGGGDDINTPPPTFTPMPPLTPTPTPPGPTPTPPPPPAPTPTPHEPIPEPASLLLFGSGLAALGAGFRRRRARASLASQANKKEA